MPLTQFFDGPGNTASGVAVYNNDVYLEGRVDDTLDRANEIAGRHDVIARGGFSAVSGGNNTFLVPFGATSVASSSPLVVGANGTSAFAVYLDPARRALTGLATYLNLTATLFVGASSPAVAFASWLAPVATWAGGSGSTVPSVASLGTTVSGSTVNHPIPSTNTRNRVSSGDFAHPAADYYVVACQYNAVAAAVGYQMVYELTSRSV